MLLPLSKVFQFFCCMAVCGLCACSSIVDSNTQKKEMMQAFINGQNDVVAQEIEEKLKSPAWYNSSRVNSGDELMWRLESGSFAFHEGHFEESIEAFQKAESLIENFDERADISVRDSAAEAGMLATNLNALPYRGFQRDRVLLSFYKSLAYLGAGREDAFRAQLKRLRNNRKQVEQDFSEEIAEEMEEIKKLRKEDLSTEVSSFSFSKDDIGRNAEFANRYAVMQEYAGKNHAGFVNPAVHFLSALSFLRDGNAENALAEFRILYQIMPNDPLVRRYYATLLSICRREFPAGLTAADGFDFPLDENCVYVLSAVGRSPSLKQVAVYFPLMTAWPVCEFYPQPFSGVTVLAGGRTYSSWLLADMNSIFAWEYEQRLPGIITRIVLSTAVKEGAYYGSMAAVGASDMNSEQKTAVIAGITIGGAVYRSLMNTADTRSWEILPGAFLLTQFPMPENRQLNVQMRLSDSMRKIDWLLKIPDGCDSALVFISAPARDNIRFHIFPFFK